LGVAEVEKASIAALEAIAAADEEVLLGDRQDVVSHLRKFTAGA
jgi:hypothetical protein